MVGTSKLLDYQICQIIGSYGSDGERKKKMIDVIMQFVKKNKDIYIYIYNIGIFTRNRDCIIIIVQR